MIQHVQYNLPAFHQFHLPCPELLTSLPPVSMNKDSTIYLANFV